MTIPSGTGATARRPRATAGRPRASSRRTLEDAASELFLEQGYAATTIDQIAHRAGVGRNTFFNYFAAKSDLLWIDFDETIGALDEILASVPADLTPMGAVRLALVELAGRHPRSGVPIGLSQHEPMATLEEFRLSGLGRFLAVTGALAGFLARRAGLPAGDLAVRSAAAAAAAALATGAGAWALAGVSRAPLAEYVDAAVGPVCRGFDPELHGAV